MRKTNFGCKQVYKTTSWFSQGFSTFHLVGNLHTQKIVFEISLLLNHFQLNNIFNKNQPVESSFEALYAGVRNVEQRIYTDEQVLLLPKINELHVHFQEWKVRKKSGFKLIAYLKKKQKPLNILEIGCGNGWLSAKLSVIKNTKVVGLNPNEIEIEQAKRVFKNNNLKFVHGNFPTALLLQGQKFDVIVFAASFQYFPSVANVINNCNEHLSDTGEIHIIDTNFYTQQQAFKAAERTKFYYDKMGYPEMAKHYFHHSINDLVPFDYRIKIDPKSLWNRLFYKSPFYWIVVKYTSPR